MKALLPKLLILIALVGGTLRAWADEEAYTVTINGLENQDIEEQWQKESLLYKLAKTPPPTQEALRRRINQDMQVLIKFLQNAGYFEATIQPFIHQKIPSVEVILDVYLGPQYTLGHFTLKTESGEIVNINDLLPGDAYIPHMQPDDPLTLEAVDEEEASLVNAMAAYGYPFAKVVKRKVLADETRKKADLFFRLKTGPKTFFGPVTIQGLKDVDKSYVLNRILWQKGGLYNAKKVDQLRRLLMQSGLFSSVEVTPSSLEEQAAHLPITITVIEGTFKYIGLGARYASQEGIGLKAFWGDKNLDHAGERLDLNLQKSRLKSSIDATFTVPDFLRPDQSLNYDLSATIERPKAYYKRSLEGGVSLERDFTPTWSGSLGVTLSYSKIRKENLPQLSRLIGFPVQVTYDTTNDILDPYEGFKSQGIITPYKPLGGAYRSFTKAHLKNGVHIPLDRQKELIFSIFANIGMMPGSQKTVISPDQRFYAGGAASVRGYAFQMAGPLDQENKPIGGKSMGEGGAEFLIKLSPEWGWVQFLETGFIDQSPFPHFNTGLYTGVGMGVRYYTTFGPIRLDVATPLKRRKKIDDRVQLYVGLGQSF